MRKGVLYFTCGLLMMSIAAMSISCKARKPRDCRGRKKTAKTEMGGWL